MRLDEQKGHSEQAWACLDFSSELPIWVNFCLMAHVSAVSTPIDKASISLIFRKISVMVRCIIAGLERGESFAQ